MATTGSAAVSRNAGRPREHRKHRHRGGERRGKRSRSRGERGGSGGGSGSSRRGGAEESGRSGHGRGGSESERRAKRERKEEREEPAPPKSAAGESSLSVEETNKLRAKLGLKPLETGPAKKEAGTKEEPVAAELINPLALRQREEIREKLAAAKEKRLLNQNLGKVKTLGEEEPWLDDAAAWIERSRALQREKELAEKRAKLLEEMDQEFGVSPLVEEEFQRRRRERYSARDLQGLTVEHDPASIPEGEEQEQRRRRPNYDPYGEQEPAPGSQVPGVGYRDMPIAIYRSILRHAARYRGLSLDITIHRSVGRYVVGYRDISVGVTPPEGTPQAPLPSDDTRTENMDISSDDEVAPPGTPPALEEDEAEQELQQQLERGRRLRQLRELREGGGEKFSASSTTILDEEPIVNRGLAAALLLCQNKGLLETTVQKVARVKAPNKSLPSAVYCIEDKMAIDDKYSRREEFRGFTQDFKEKDGYRPDVKIEYVDETGRKLTPKEAFRQLSHRFHGKGSGKMKTERRMKKLDEEALLKKMSSSDTPLGTVALLQEKQRAQKTPYIVLSGSGKSMNANTITK
uniref:U4/U6.U5 tri-snRNP-associated protein 1 n=1 Tax=Lonchura striata TaxID=40157 RepID=UPI000B4CAA50|nr:U4/U6.U5 tri-snRNP-associated protein 1 [Lonchura striata domestica]